MATAMADGMKHFGSLPCFGSPAAYLCNMLKAGQLTGNLTPDQAAAVTTTEGRIRVIAGAGSGKTRALVHRYVYLRSVLGVPQSDILCMTFTNKAAQEWRRPISGMIPGGATGDFVTTIHGFCVKFLREEIYRLGYPENYLILDEDDMKSLVREVLEENGVERKAGIVGNHMEELGQFKGRTPYIERWLLPDSALPPAGEIPILVQMLLRQRRYFALDFDDLLLFALHILNAFPVVLEKWRDRFQYVMVDEVQDCSAKEWELFTMLSGKYGNLFIVGDGDQSIYEWRGAAPSLFIGFQSDTDIWLKENFRSVPNIVCLADCIIGNNRNRLPRTSITMRPSGGERTVLYHCKNEKAEGDRLAKKLKRFRSRNGFAWKDMAVLYRASYLTRAIEQSLIREQIPYVVWGGVRFFERKEIKDALAYLRLVALDDDLDFRRVVNEPSRKIGRKSMELVSSVAEKQGCSLSEALRLSLPRLKNPAAGRFVQMLDDMRGRLGTRSISGLLDDVIAASGLLEKYRADTEEERLENLQELVKSVKVYEDERREDDVTVETYLQDIALYTNADYRKDDDRVRLMTIHQAKGLEFRLVWIYGLNEGVLPSHRTIRERGEAGLEEERRLMYVACTRAMDRLCLSESEGYNVQNSQGKFPSRFIREAKDIMGDLYDIDGPFRPGLWEGTDRLIGELEGPAPEHSSFRDGDRVHHPVFGDGTIDGMDVETGNVSVVFDEFGKRRIDHRALSAVLGEGKQN